MNPVGHVPTQRSHAGKWGEPERVGAIREGCVEEEAYSGSRIGVMGTKYKNYEEEAVVGAIGWERVTGTGGGWEAWKRGLPM